MKWLTFAQVCSVSLVLAACGSSPKTAFFTLTATPSQSYGSQSRPRDPIQVVSVNIPAVLDRKEMVSRGANNSLTVSDQNRWGAPLDEMIQQVLTQDLAARLSSAMVVLPQEPAPIGTRSLVLDILEFSDGGAGKIVFDGNWSLVESGAKSPVASENVRLSVPVQSGNAASQAQGMSSLLGELSDRIAAKLAGS